MDSQHILASDGEHLNLTSVSIVIPVYNESQRIGRTLELLGTYLREAPFSAEVIVADDGSSDETTSIARELSDRFDDFRLLELRHGGKARAVVAGLCAARNELVGFMDADLATPLQTIVTAIDRVASGADIAIGSREGVGSRRIGEPAYRHFMGRIFNGIVRLTLLPGIDDTQCGFKFMTRTARDRILPLARLYPGEETVTRPTVTAFDVELLYIARCLGLEIAVIPVTWEYGTSSKVNPIRDTIQNLRDVALVWINGRRGLYEE